MPAADLRTIAAIEADIELAKESYVTAVSYSTAMGYAESAAYSTYRIARENAYDNANLACDAACKDAYDNAYSAYTAAWHAVAIAQSEAYQIADKFRTLREELDRAQQSACKMQRMVNEQAPYNRPR